MRRLGALLTCVALVLPATAQTDPATAARQAAQKLELAAMALQEAERARDRVAALTQTVQAYEDGLTALREGLRRAAIREQAIVLELDARREEIARLVGVLGSMQHAPEVLLLLHPSGPVGTARAGMLLSEAMPALQSEADALAARLGEVAQLRSLQESAEATLAEGLAGAQRARTALSQAISNRTDLPRRYVSDPQGMRQLLESTDTLEGFASGLASLGGDRPLPAGGTFESLRGTLPLPVRGVVLRGWGEADAAGVERPGWLIATPPLALVTTPAAATVRYAGPLLDYGNVMILEPAGDTLLVLAGLAQVYAEEGEVLTAGAPVGLMGGADPAASAFPSDSADAGGAERPETLYMELRQENAPVDPAEWFDVRKDETR